MTLTARQVRNHNRRTIYKLLLRMGRTTKTELAALSGLSVPTVLKIVSHLEERGLVRQDDEAQPPQAQGRPPQVLRFCASRAYVIGARYEGDLLYAGLVDLCGRVRRLRTRRVSCGFEQLIRTELPSLIDELMAQEGAARRLLLGVGLAFPRCANRTAAPSTGRSSWANRGACLWARSLRSCARSWACRCWWKTARTWRRWANTRCCGGTRRIFCTWVWASRSAAAWSHAGGWCRDGTGSAERSA
ncbi:MAG: winged helix-turn-helix domain-containing protein [Candidatus Spyradocola sp.]|nr:winged helix-turn-helix domain-containing protein [Candidatus Spyradocola sp.]